MSNVHCSFLKEEWQYLDQEASRSDIPFADSIWRELPDRIVNKTIAVNVVLKYLKFAVITI